VTRLKEAGLSILINRQNVEALAAFADRHYILEKGRVVWSGIRPSAAESGAATTDYLGLAKPCLALGPLQPRRSLSILSIDNSIWIIISALRQRGANAGRTH